MSLAAKAFAVSLSLHKLRLRSEEKAAFAMALALTALAGIMWTAYLVSHYLGHRTDPMPAFAFTSLGIALMACTLGISAHRRIGELERRRPGGFA